MIDEIYIMLLLSHSIAIICGMCLIRLIQEFLDD